MKKTRKEVKKQAKRDLDPMELCRVMASLGCGDSCLCSASLDSSACAC